MIIIQFLLSAILFVAVFMGTWWVLLKIEDKYGERVSFITALVLLLLTILSAIVYEASKL